MQKKSPPVSGRVSGLIFAGNHNHQHFPVPLRENLEVERRIREGYVLTIENIPVSVVSGENASPPALFDFANRELMGFDFGEDGTDNVHKPVRASLFDKVLCAISQDAIPKKN
jgi:hypothetical protein